MLEKIVGLSLQNYAVTTSLESLVQGYILNCKCENKSPATIDTYHRFLKCFLWYCRACCYPDSPNKITPNNIRQFLLYLASESNRWGIDNPSSRSPACQATVNHYYRVLCTFFNWLKDEDLITENPVSRIKTPKIESKVVKALSPKEAEALLNQCSSKTCLSVRNRAVLMMLLDTGIRVSEISNLQVSDIDLKTGSFLVRRGKGGKQRVVRIGVKAQKALWRYLTGYKHGESEYLFLNRSGGRLNDNAIKRMVRQLGKKANIENVHVHRLRHTFAISFLRAGGDVFSLKYLMGHSTLYMTQRYLKSLSAEDAIKAHKRFSPLDNMEVR